MTDGQSIDNTSARKSLRTAHATKMTSAVKSWVCAFALVLLAFLVYQPVWHAGFIWDDDVHVTENTNLHSPQGLWRIWFEPLADPQYYPFQLTSFWIEYHLWGLRPLGYHIVNVLLHAANAVLIWLVLRQLQIPGAWFAAAIFAVHPVEVESVAWVSELKNLLSTTFYLAAMLAFFRYRPLTDESQARPASGRFAILSLVLFLCALLSKTVACTLPAVLVLLLWWKRGRVKRPDIKVLGPMFLLGISLGLVTMWLERHHVGASGAEWSLSFVQRGLLAGHVLWFYAAKLFWPRALIFIYPHWQIRPGTWWQYLFPLAVLTVLWGLWSLRSRIGRGPLVAVLCFAGTLAPALGFFDVFPFRYSYVADHFQYLACIGLIALAVGTVATVCNRSGPWGRELGAIVVAMVLLILGVSSWQQARIYRDAETVWRDTIAKNPGCWLAHNNLGNILVREGNVSDAIVHYEQALQSKPVYAEAHGNLANALYREGRIEEAIAHYEQALRSKPDYAEAHCNLGMALARQGRLTEATEHFEQAVRIKPDYATAQYNLGIALGLAGRAGEAIAHLKEAVRIKPDFAQARSALAQMQANR
ncbi:MAG TPA: tetratricopeptide repeat protein [Verrucomicrobiae bacterium]|nr:tetratricopeptide repeat protein [Verrucomicrobiae bacterium]